MKLEAAGRPARAEVQGHTAVLKRTQSQPGCALAKHNDHVSHSHLHIEVIMRVCELAK